MKVDISAFSFFSIKLPVTHYQSQIIELLPDKVTALAKSSGYQNYTFFFFFLSMLSNWLQSSYLVWSNMFHIKPEQQNLIKLFDCMIFKLEANEAVVNRASIFNLDSTISVKVNSALAIASAGSHVVQWRDAQMQRQNHLVQLILTESPTAKSGFTQNAVYFFSKKKEEMWQTLGSLQLDDIQPEAADESGNLHWQNYLFVISKWPEGLMFHGRYRHKRSQWWALKREGFSLRSLYCLFVHRKPLSTPGIFSQMIPRLQALNIIRGKSNDYVNPAYTCR